MKWLRDVLVTLGLATAIHLDWHAARPAHHQLSLGLSWHWLLAVPVFALVAWYVHRAWPTRAFAASVAIIGIAAALAALVEPAWELLVDGAPWDWAFGPARRTAFGTFLAVGVLTHVVFLAAARRR